MKKSSLLCLLMLVSSSLFAQQQIHFVNTTSYDIAVSYIATTSISDTDGTGSPQLMSSTGFTIPSGTTYSATHPQLFPYNSFPGAISNWTVAGNGEIPSFEALSEFGGIQKFYFAKISVQDASLPVSDGGSIGQNFGFSQSYINGVYVDFYFTVNYPDPTNNPNWVLYTILAI